MMILMLFDDDDDESNENNDAADIAWHYDNLSLSIDYDDDADDETMIKVSGSTGFS